MKKLFPILFLIYACSTNTSNTENHPFKDTFSAKTNRKKDLSDPSNTLTGKTETLELEYIVWGCACANWITKADRNKYENGELEEHCIFIEPAMAELNLPSYFDAYKHKIKVDGQFYVKPDYPKGTIETEEQSAKAKVFRYTKIEVLGNDEKNKY